MDLEKEIYMDFLPTFLGFADKECKLKKAK